MEDGDGLGWTITTGKNFAIVLSVARWLIMSRKPTTPMPKAMPMTSQAGIENRIQAFRRDLETLNDAIIIQKHVTFG